MGGDWLFRLDSADQGLHAALHAHDEHRRLGDHEGAQRLERARTRSNESMAGSIGWYRKDFRLP